MITSETKDGIEERSLSTFICKECGKAFHNKYQAEDCRDSHKPKHEHEWKYTRVRGSLCRLCECCGQHGRLEITEHKMPRLWEVLRND